MPSVNADLDTRITRCHRRHVGELEAYARSLLGGDHFCAQDIVQEAFIRTYRTLRDDPDREIALRPWLYRAVRNAAVDELRSARRRHVVPGAPEPDATAQDALAALLARDAVHDALRRVAALPERQRVALMLRAFGGLDHDEIGRALGTSRGSSRVLVHRARAAAAAA
jgi:RNA polymerase sigma-70 factor (ECF subfamily)